ncbi:MAG: hypothetical protein ACRC57_13530 [Sarcina sp.]
MSKHKISIIIGCALVVVVGGTFFATEMDSNKTVQPAANTDTTTNTAKLASNSKTTSTIKPLLNSNTTNTTSPKASSNIASTTKPTSTSNMAAPTSNTTTASKNNNTYSSPHVDNMQTGGMPAGENTTSTNSNTIKIINYSSSQIIEPNDLIVENTTGKPISNTQLLSVIKNWILTEQYSYSGFADVNGTMWSEPWLTNIPSDQLINYFTQANGQSALSQNITAEELNKAAIASLAYAKAHPNPFSQEQTDSYIKQMLNTSYPNQTITQIIFHGNDTQGGLYYVYTKQFGTTQPFWYVASNTGYATGN